MLTLEVHLRLYRNIQLLLSIIHWLCVDVNSVNLNSVRRGRVTPSYSYWIYICYYICCTTHRFCGTEF